MDIRSRVGARLAGYRIDSVIGRGGMGVVYLAEHLRLHRKVALKVISPELSSDERFRRRFLRESEIAASLDHPHVIPIYDAGEADGELFLAMRYVEGTDLGQRLRERRQLPLDEVCDLVAQLCDALDRAHAHGLVHRDVKPENVLLAAGEGDGGRDHLYLCDFGLGKSATSLHPQTSTDRVVGTVDYLAPEVIAGSSATAASDLYAVGCLTYLGLAGHLPFPRGNDIATLWAHMHDPPPSLHAAVPGLPAELDPVLRRALAKAPEDRQRTCGAFSRDLSAAASPAPTVATRAPGMHRWRYLAAGAVALAALIAAIALGRRGESSNADRSRPAPPVLGRVTPFAVVGVDPTSMQPAQQIASGGLPDSIAAGAGAVWVGNISERRIDRIDPSTGGSSQVSLHGPPTAVAVGGGSVWVLEGEDQYIAEIDRAGEKRRQRRLEELCCRGPGAIAANASSLWIALGDSTTHYGVPHLGTGVAKEGTGSAGLAATPGEEAGLWQSDGHRQVVHRSDDLEVIERLPSVTSDSGADGRPSGITVDEDFLWVAATALDQVWRFPLSGSGPPTVVDGIDQPTAVAAGFGSVWVVSPATGVLTRIDPRSLKRQAVDLGLHLGGVAVAGGKVWVTTQPRQAAQGSTSPPCYVRHGRIQIISGNPIRGRWPTWFPDGSHLAFSRDGQLWTSRWDGDNAAPLGVAGQEPAWGPRGVWIAYATGAKGGRQLAMVKSDGSQPTVLLTGSEADNHAPAWSPDGRRLAYLSTDAAGATSIHVMHPTRSGGDHDRIVESGDVSPPVWSSDGNDLAFWSDKDGSGIYLLSVDDGQLTKLASLPGPSPDPATVRLSWAPDGRTIAIAAGGRIFEVYADGSGMSPSGNQSDVQTVAYRPQATPSAHQPG